jgi:hypothetical protein
MSLLIIAYCLLLRALDAFHREKAVVAFSPHVAAAFLWNRNRRPPIQQGEGDLKNFKHSNRSMTSRTRNVTPGVGLLVTEQRWFVPLQRFKIAKHTCFGPKQVYKTPTLQDRRTNLFLDQTSLLDDSAARSESRNRHTPASFCSIAPSSGGAIFRIKLHSRNSFSQIERAIVGSKL